MMKIFTLIIFITVTINSLAQNYTRDAGIRAGTFFGCTYRQYMDETKAFEGIISVGFARSGLRFTALKQYFKPAFYEISDNLFVCYGYGAHVGFNYSNRYNILFKTYRLDEWRMSPLFGIDAYFALEYNFREFPLSLGIDFKPFFEFSTSRIFYIFLDDTAVSLKYKF